MNVLRSIAELRAARVAMPGRVGAVYTMGALHDGHIALVRAARAENDYVLATIFVNPTQFSPAEDFASYPRTLERDLEALQAAGADAVFVPDAAAMYPPDFQTTVTLAGVTAGLEGARRPGHFAGVATVVSKLFNLTQPDISYFGQKDAQQVVVLRQLVRDLNFPLQIAVIPTVREADGLAMSSRNRRLSSEERAAAPVVCRAIRAASTHFESGERRTSALLQAVAAVIAAEPRAHLDYAALNDPLTLAPAPEVLRGPALLSLTVQIGEPHLLDNALLPLALNNRADLSLLLGPQPAG
jgi:pantoate--beta-alanine ligase